MERLTPVGSVGKPGHRSEGREEPPPLPRQCHHVPQLPSFTGEGSVGDFFEGFENHAKHSKWTEQE